MDTPVEDFVMNDLSVIQQPEQVGKYVIRLIL